MGAIQSPNFFCWPAAISLYLAPWAQSAAGQRLLSTASSKWAHSLFPSAVLQQERSAEN